MTLALALIGREEIKSDTSVTNGTLFDKSDVAPMQPPYK
jgi:hypothetical protein